MEERGGVGCCGTMGIEGLALEEERFARPTLPVQVVPQIPPSSGRQEHDATVAVLGEVRPQGDPPADLPLAASRIEYYNRRRRHSALRNQALLAFLASWKGRR